MGNSEKWIDARRLAWERQGGKCQICLTQLPFADVVGHHVKNKSKGGKDTADNCRARCRECENWAHRIHATGNPGAGAIRRYRRYYQAD